jgi:NSS family neurotransmitter:Na+ symporter
LPHIFSQLPVGGFIAILFFIALLLAALTSSISLLEVIVAFCIEEFHIHRRTAVTISLTVLWVLGCLCSLSQGVLSGWKLFGKNIFDFFDFVSANVLMLLGGLLVVLFVGWKLGRTIIHDELTNSGKLRIPAWFVDVLTFLVRYLAPAAIITIAVFQWI